MSNVPALLSGFCFFRLKEAEEESEEDSDEDVELEFDERAKISTIKQKVSLESVVGSIH